MNRGPGYRSEVVIGTTSTARENIEAQIAHDNHVANSEIAQLRLLREDLLRRESAVAEMHRAMGQMIEDQRRLAEDQQRATADTTKILTEVILTAAKRVSELNDGIAAIAEQSASAAMAQIERAKITAELMHRTAPPPPNGWVEVGKHATDILGRLAESVLAANPALAAKAADALGAVAQSVGSEKESASRPAYTLADIALARDALTDEELSALAHHKGVSVESLPLDVLIAAARQKISKPSEASQ